MQSDRSTRAARSRRQGGTDRLLDAALAQAADAGWAGLQVQPVAARAGMSSRPVRERWLDRPGLAVALWHERLAAPLSEAVRAVLDARPAGGRGTDAARLRAALTTVAGPGPALQAATELLLVAAWQPDLADAVRATLGRDLAADLSPEAGHTTPAEAAWHAYLTALALGLLVDSWRPDAAGLDLTVEAHALVRALDRAAPPPQVPEIPATHLDDPIDFGTGDPTWDTLLRATLDQVADRGYDATTLESISQATGFSQGVVFHRYATKRDLFVDATRRMVGQTTAANYAYQLSIAAEHGEGIAEALVMRAFLEPGRRRQRVIAVEQMRLPRTDPDLQAIILAQQAEVAALVASRLPDLTAAEVAAHLHVQFAAGSGFVVLPIVCPDAWRLPFASVTIPLHDSSASRG